MGFNEGTRGDPQYLRRSEDELGGGERLSWVHMQECSMVPSGEESSVSWEQKDQCHWRESAGRSCENG